MGYQHQRSGKVEQIFFQDFQRRNVQIVGRLVKQQNVGRLQHQFGNQHPRPLAAAQVADRLIQLFAGKQEARGPAGHMHRASLVDDAIALRSQRAAQREALIQLAHLAEVDDP